MGESFDWVAKNIVSVVATIGKFVRAAGFGGKAGPGIAGFG